MADEKLAAKVYGVAIGIGHHATPDIELYTCIHSVKCLLSCRYTDSEFKEILEALQHRTLWLADLFPFFQAPQSNADFLAQEDKTLILMRQLLHALIDKIDDPKSTAEIDHSYVRVFYQAYEACLKNWYQKNHDPETEKKFRQRLMQELLVSKQWKVDDLNYNLNAPWPLTNLDEQGWTRPKSVLPLAEKANVPTYKTIHGAELNYKTGEMAFILDYCEKNESDHNRLLTIFDLNELFQRRLTSALFSLDPVDPDMPYHPFNQMRFVPSILYHSQLLHTMLLTDYLLKFLTVGQEVQCRDPYELRSLDKITNQLPAHLKKIIDDFHASHHEESLNRFWIESEEVELAIDDEGLSKDGDVLFALGDIRMVVKHHKLKRDAEGHLVDKEGEDEGWDCYVLTQEQKRELGDGKRVIADSALIIIQESWELIFWENHKATYRFTLEEDKHNLIRLSKRQRDVQEKVKTDDSESLRQIYRIVLKAAEKVNMPHHYSPEFIFAQEFTKYYNEFAVYFPEFGRLRELSKAATLVNVMAAQRAANQEKVHLIRKRLNYKQFCDLQSDSRCSKEQIMQKRQKSLDDIRQKIGPLKFTRSSPEIQDMCSSSYDKVRSDYIDQHGLLSWGWYSTVSCDVRREVIEPQIPKFIADLEAQKKAAGCEQLLKRFENELAELSRLEASQLVDKFLEGDDKPLHKHLVYYDRKQVAKKIKEIYPEQPIDIDDYWQTTGQKLKEIVRKGITKQFEEWQKQLSKEKIKQKRQESLNDIRQQIGTLYFTESSPEIRDICDRCYDEIRSDIIAEHGYSGWNSVSHKVYREAIRPKIPKFITDLQTQKRAACHKQLSELFKDELSGSEASQLIDGFLEGNDDPLHKHLVYYDRKQVAKKIKEIYPEHTTHSLDKALNSSPPIIDKIIESETKKALEEHKRQLQIQLSGREKLEQSFVDLGFATDIEEVDLEGTCLWVPASFRHDVEKGHSRAVYGGVHIAGMAYRSINPKQVKILLRQTSEASKRLWQNKIRGDTLSTFCAKFLTKLLSSDSRFEVKERYRVKTPSGLRILDIVAGKIGKNGKFEPVVGYEIKAGDSPYVRPDSEGAEMQGEKPTKQGTQDVWIEKEREKEEKGTSFPIHCVRVEELNKDYCKVQ